MTRIKILTKKEFDKIPSGMVFENGVLPNSPEGIYMSDDRKGDNLKWLAKKGFANDWAIYCDWAEHSLSHVCQNGQKVTDIENIRKCVPCVDEVIKAYRK